MRTYGEMSALVDVRAVLPSVHVPTLVLVRADAKLPKGGVDVEGVEEAQWVAARIPGATFVTVEGRDYLPWFGNQEALVDEIARFVTGEQPAPKVDRVLLTLLFTDLVGSTARAAELGDQQWRELLDRHNTSVRSCAHALQRPRDRPRGRRLSRHVRQPGTGGARRAGDRLRAGRARLDVRAGVHTGEVELLDEGGIGGITVHTGARVAGLGGAGDVLVTRTVRDLTAGSGLEFEPRGTHALRGVPGEWDLFAPRGA